MISHHHAICPCCEHAATGSPCRQMCIWAGMGNDNLFSPIRPTKAERKAKKARKRQKSAKKNPRDYENIRRHARPLSK